MSHSMLKNILSFIQSKMSEGALREHIHRKQPAKEMYHLSEEENRSSKNEK